MRKLDHFNKLVSDFSQSVDFVTVYLQEAHASNGWTKDINKYNIAYHTNIDQRIDAAKLLLENGVTCPIVIDKMEGDASDAYGARPESLYVIVDGVVQFQGLGPFAYDPSALRSWIESKVNKKK